MRTDKRGMFAVGISLLFLLAAFVLLVSKRSRPIAPAAPIVTSAITVTHRLTEKVAVSVTHGISMVQTNMQSDWLTFIDEAAGYSIQYPANFVVRSNRSKGEVYSKTDITFLALGVKGYHAMTIMVDVNPQKLSLEMLYEELHKNLSGTKESNNLAQITVAGMAAYQTSVFPGSTDFHILLPYDDKVFHFALVHDLGPIESDPKAKAIFFQILNTFRITNPE